MIDWIAIARAHRARRPLRLRPARGRTAISADGAYHAAVLAARPFRLGTRFRAIPDVRFYRGDHLVRGPGELLPGPGDRTFAHYVARLGAAPFQVLIAQPLGVDFELWAEVRALLRALFERIGHPVLPVVAELVLGTFTRSPRGFTKRLDHDVVTVMLEGRLRARLWDTLGGGSPNELREPAHRPSTVLDARAGDLLYWPADHWHLDEALAPCLALRLWIPASGSRTTSVVKHVLTELMAARLDADESVPYLPYQVPPRRLRSGGGATIRPLLRAGAALDELARGPELERELAILWAKRVSTCGLEPPPAPLAVRLAGSDRIRVDPRTQIVRMKRRRDGEAIWAANGYAFALRGPGERALRRIVASLERRDAQVDALCGTDAGLRSVLELLAEVRALIVTPAEA